MSGIRTRAPGELEAEVLRILRTRTGAIGAREIRAAFTQNTPAYTTILTALDRLTDKGEVERDQLSPRRVRFRAVHSEVDTATAAMLGALGALGAVDDRGAALLKFAGDLDESDLALLRAALRRRTSS